MSVSEHRSVLHNSTLASSRDIGLADVAFCRYKLRQAGGAELLPERMWVFCVCVCVCVSAL